MYNNKVMNYVFIWSHPINILFFSEYMSPRFTLILGLGLCMACNVLNVFIVICGCYLEQGGYSFTPPF